MSEQQIHEKPQTNSTDSTPPSPPHPFRLSIVSFIAAGLVLLGGLFIALRGTWSEGIDSYNMGTAIGGALGTLILPLLFGWCAYLVFRRSNFVGNAVFLILLVLVLVGQGSAAVRRSQTKKSLAEVHDIAKEFQQAREVGDQNQAKALADRAIEKTNQAAASATGDDKKVIEFTAGFMKQSNDISSAYHKEINAFNAAGGETCTGLTDTAAFDARLALLDKAIKTQENLQQFFTGIEERVPAQMREKGLPVKAIEGFLKGFTQGGRLQAVLRTQELEGAMLNMMGARLVILRDNLGQWTCSEDGTITFSAGAPKEAIARYNELADSLGQAVNEQEELKPKITGK